MDISENNAQLWSQRWAAPAKLNLMLRIVGQRADGYHLLQTVFQFVEWCDWLTFYPTTDERVFLQKPLPDVPEETDLVIRAANLLKKAAGCNQGVCIEVEKNLPMGGGLGGGSSDAATTLCVLNRLWNIHFSTEKLMQLGLQLGADVPVFVYGQACWAEGVGEKVSKISLPEQWVIIIKPDCHVNTREIFLSKELTRDSKPITIVDFLVGQQQNDCLAVVTQRYAPVAQALASLSAFAPARLTGTGACVFALFESEAIAQHAYTSLQKDWQAYLTKCVNVSPLLAKLENF